jgi:hypothetical protein
MDLNKLNSGEKIAGVSSILLFIFMFFDWFYAEVTIGGSGASEGVTAWDALDWIPIWLVITILAALIVVGLRLSDSSYEPPVSGNAIVAILGGVSFLLILYRIIDPPGGSASAPGISFDVGPEFWIFVALVCAAGIAYGGYKAMQDEGATFGDLGDRFSSGGPSGGGGGRGTAGDSPSTPQQPPAPPASQTPPPPSQTPPPPPQN